MTQRHPETSTFALKDGTRMRVLHWAAPSPTKNVLLIQHGIGEHAGRYQTWVDELQELPLDIWAFDARGHGHSDGPRGHAAHGIKTLADDLDEVLAHVKEKTGSDHIFLGGHSLGAAVVTQFATSRTPDAAIRGYILSAPAMRIPRSLSVRVKLALGNVLGAAMPRLTLPTGLDANGISSDPAEVERYKNDALIHDKISAALGLSLVRDAEALPQLAHKIDRPVLAYQGDADPIVDIDGTRIFVKGLGTPDVTYKELVGSRHETHHETPEKRAVLFDTMRAWIRPRLVG